jgi:hypothetical protein
MLLRHGRVWRSGSSWTQAHEQQLAGQRSGSRRWPRRWRITGQRWMPAARSWTPSRLSWRRGQAGNRSPERWRGWGVIGHHRELNSLALAAEVVDWHRFPSARAFMGFTAPGARRVHPAAMKPAAARSPKPAPNQCAPLWQRPRGPTGSSPRSASRCAAGNATRSRAPWARSWKAQRHLHAKYKAATARGKPQAVAVIAVARELAGFVWAEMTS